MITKKVLIYFATFVALLFALTAFEHVGALFTFAVLESYIGEVMFLGISWAIIFTSVLVVADLATMSLFLYESKSAEAWVMAALVNVLLATVWFEGFSFRLGGWSWVALAIAMAVKFSLFCRIPGIRKEGELLL